MGTHIIVQRPGLQSRWFYKPGQSEPSPIGGGGGGPSPSRLSPSGSLPSTARHACDLFCTHEGDDAVPSVVQEAAPKPRSPCFFAAAHAKSDGSVPEPHAAAPLTSSGEAPCTTPKAIMCTRNEVPNTPWHGGRTTPRTRLSCVAHNINLY